MRTCGPTNPFKLPTALSCMCGQHQDIRGTAFTSTTGLILLSDSKWNSRLVSPALAAHYLCLGGWGSRVLNVGGTTWMRFFHWDGMSSNSRSIWNHRNWFRLTFVQDKFWKGWGGGDDWEKNHFLLSLSWPHCNMHDMWAIVNHD